LLSPYRRFIVAAFVGKLKPNPQKLLSRGFWDSNKTGQKLAEIEKWDFLGFFLVDLGEKVSLWG